MLAWWLVPSSSRRFRRSRSPSPCQGAVAPSQPPDAVTSAPRMFPRHTCLELSRLFCLANHCSAPVTGSVPEMARPFTFTASDSVTVSFVNPRAVQQTLAGQGVKWHLRGGPVSPRVLTSHTEVIAPRIPGTRDESHGRPPARSLCHLRQLSPSSLLLGCMGSLVVPGAPRHRARRPAGPATFSTPATLSSTGHHWTSPCHSGPSQSGHHPTKEVALGHLDSSGKKVSQRCQLGPQRWLEHTSRHQAGPVARLP